ncbi:two-component system, sensor histidine kinase YesM [Paenibacillus algorifonticola]|uniref:histidine kinase n=1 Tax=Paenibacillus algorifonticola TaxID=684063 RepID=A0A1I2GM54_9BACL|nr:sensor histidine kinase [Paenibacillus algorifonticola]SFF18572.1 two-component system, sensor histidine kinase YesM [Paenibacillus algorifonticola]
MKLMRWIFSSLRAKLLLMFIILTSVPLIAVGLISYQKSYNAVSDHSKAATMLVVGQLGNDIDALLEDTGRLLELENNPQVLHYLFSQTDTYEDAKAIIQTMNLYRETYKYESVLNITVVNLYGRGLSERKGVFQLDRNPLRNPHFQYLLNHPDEVLNIPPPDASPLDRLDGFHYSQHNVISIMATVKQQITHEVIGFIVIDLDDSIIERYCENITLGESGYVYVVDQAGNPIFLPSAMTSLAKAQPPADLSTQLALQQNSYVDYSNGRPKFVAFTTSSTTGWKIVGSVPLQEIVAEANEIRQLIIISVLLSIVFAITLHYFITARLTRPIQLLKSKMRLAAGGFLEVKVQPSGHDEIADLGNSFNIMLEKIKRLLKQSIEEQEHLQKAELRTLQAQINPHFLYNTLDSIVWMAEAGRSGQVIQLVQALSRFFRISLNRGRDWIALKDELEHVQSYLIIQQMRYRDILEYELDVPEALKDLPILKMTLQPIVENALYHGIKNKRGKGLIRITAYASHDSDVYLMIEDNGIGMKPERLAELREALRMQHIPEETGSEVSGGFGLHNVQQRLRLYYGEAYTVIVESEDQLGTKVTIRIPMERMKPNEKGYAR